MFFSVARLRKLLDAFLDCWAPLNRLVPELLDRLVKALDICNAVTSGVDAVRHFQKLAEIAVSALEQRPIGDGQVRRAKKALNSLLAAMALEDKDGIGNKATEEPAAADRHRTEEARLACGRPKLDLQATNEWRWWLTGGDVVLLGGFAILCA